MNREPKDTVIKTGFDSYVASVGRDGWLKQVRGMATARRFTATQAREIAAANRAVQLITVPVASVVAR